MADLDRGLANELNIGETADGLMAVAADNPETVQADIESRMATIREISRTAFQSVLGSSRHELVRGTTTSSAVAGSKAA